MIVKLTQIDGCLWCPFHTTYVNDNVKEGRCKKVLVRKNNYKLIRHEEMVRIYGKDNHYDYCNFPTWCPLESREVADE